MVFSPLSAYKQHQQPTKANKSVGYEFIIRKEEKNELLPGSKTRTNYTREPVNESDPLQNKTGQCNESLTPNFVPVEIPPVKNKIPTNRFHY